MKTLSSQVLNEIAIETRQCFLSEDAPGYLANLQQGLAQVQEGKPDYIFLMHAAHSLKGGAAIAELSSLSLLAHKLEDMLEILQHNEFCDRATIAGVLSHGIDEVASVLSQANGLPQNTLIDIKIDLELLQRLDSLLEPVKASADNSKIDDEKRNADIQDEHLIELSQHSSNHPKTTINPIIRSALEKDLEACIQQVETLLLSNSSTSEAKVRKELQYFCEGCLLLGDTLNLDWLINTIEPFDIKLQQEKEIASLLPEISVIISSLKSQRDRYLKSELTPAEVPSSNSADVNISEIKTSEVKPSAPPASFNNKVESTELENAKLENAKLENAKLENAKAESNKAESNKVEASRTEEHLPVSPLTLINDKSSTKKQALSTTKETVVPSSEVISYLRIPSLQIESMTNTVAEMILRHERLLRQQQQLGQTNKNLQSLVLQMIPLQEQVQTIYDKLATEEISSQDEKNNDSSLNDSINNGFDQLELDQYSSSHTTLQNLQEVLLRVRESRSDIDLSYRDLGEEIEYLRQDLDRLYAQLTQSRLVPFKALASRFLPQLKRLCQRYNKQVNLIIVGEDVPIDQVILERLQTPLNHLLINAFDHGVEMPDVRVASGKPATAILTLSAVVSGNQVIISLNDDGDGIDIDRVYFKAVEKNICPAEIPIDNLSRQELLDFVFQPHFSTRDVVSQISGRGMGLDIVRSQINSLRGNIQVETLQGKGTTFKIRLPLGLSLINLLICEIAENLIAIPADDILDIFPYGEIQVVGNKKTIEITWRKNIIPLMHLKESLPYIHKTDDPLKARVCLVLNRNDQPIAVAIDAIVEERQLILKPFDRSVAVPSYLAGCTILGTGQVVPVLIAENLHILLKKDNKKINKKTKKIDNKQITTTTNAKTVLIAEDSIATRNMLERVLKQLDIEVISCRDGQEALDMLNRMEGKVSMVISDVEMPRVNGFNLLQTIRTHDSWYAIPVVMLTSRTGDRHRQKAISLGANGYLSKPIVVGELIDCLGEFVI